MIFDPADWPIRTIPRDRIVDHFMISHYGLVVGSQDEASARSEVEAALDHWLALDLGVSRGTTGEQLFDPVEATNFMVAAGAQGEDDFWESHYTATRQRLVETLLDLPPGSGSPILPPNAARRFRAHLERVYDVSEAAPGSRARLRLPLPIEDDALGGLELECSGPADATIRWQPARLDANLTLASPGQVPLAMTASFEARTDAGFPCSLSEDERALYTRPREDLIHVCPLAREAAATATAGLSDDWRRATAMFDYVMDSFHLGAVPYRAVDRENPNGWAFRSGFLDCQTGSALLCAMCRSVGIPARLIAGYQLYRANTAYHYWAQVWIPDRGWLSLDLATWHLSRRGTDPRWRNVFVGALDYRMKVQVLPDLFTGPSTRRLPPDWHMLLRHLPNGLEARYVDAHSGALIYRDRLTLLEP